MSFATQFFELFAMVYKSAPKKFRQPVISLDLVPKLCAGAVTKAKSIHLSIVKLIRSIIVADNLIIPHFIASKTVDVAWVIYKKHERRPNLVNSTF